jgi:hypothetical protein
MQRTTRVLLAAAATLGALIFTAFALADVGAVTYDGTAALSADGRVATVTVTAVCSSSDPAQTGSASVTLLQPSGRMLALGSGSSNIACDGTTHSVDVLVPTQTTPYKKGWATVEVSVSYFDAASNTFANKDISGGIKLSGK